MNSDEPSTLATWRTADPATIGLYTEMVSCSRDEHCYFKVSAGRSGSSFWIDDSSDVRIGHLPG